MKSDTNGRMLNARYGVDGLRTKKQDANGNSSREYGVGISTSASTPLTQNSTAPSISYISGHMILGAEINGEFVYHLGDALSTVRDVVDDEGDVIRSFEFDEYGNMLSSSGSGAASPKTWIGGLSVNDDRADSGLWNMGHRNYAGGVLGRFISRDPIGFAGGLNLYAYPTNPVGFVDPGGLDEVPAPPILPREVWRPDPIKPDRLSLDPNRKFQMIVHHEGYSACFSPNTIVDIQRKHFETEGAGDIGYNFIIDRSGNIFQGRDLKYQAAHVVGHNPGSIGILMMGNYSDFGGFRLAQNRKPTKAANNSLIHLLAYLGDKYGIDVSSKTVKAHGQVVDTGCPGNVADYLQGTIHYAEMLQDSQ